MVWYGMVWYGMVWYGMICAEGTLLGAGPWVIYDRKKKQVIHSVEIIEKYCAFFFLDQRRRWKAWPAGVSLPGQRAQRKGVAIGAEGMAGCKCYF